MSERRGPQSPHLRPGVNLSPKHSPLRAHEDVCERESRRLTATTPRPVRTPARVDSDLVSRRRVCVCSPTRLHPEHSALDPLSGLCQRTVLAPTHGALLVVPTLPLLLACAFASRFTRDHHRQHYHGRRSNPLQAQPCSKERRRTSYRPRSRQVRKPGRRRLARPRRPRPRLSRVRSPGCEKD